MNYHTLNTYDDSYSHIRKNRRLQSSSQMLGEPDVREKISLQSSVRGGRYQNPFYGLPSWEQPPEMEGVG